MSRPEGESLRSPAVLLRHLPEGGRLWVRGGGRSMWPLLRGGDAVQVLRCGPDAVAPGDIAVLARADGGLTAHFVVGTAPLRTASLLGREDSGAELLGRVVRLRTRGRSLPVPVLTRPLFFTGHRLVVAAWRSPRVRAAWRLGQQGLLSPWTRAARAWWLGAITVRRCRPEEVEGLLVFAAHHLPNAEVEALRRRLAGGEGEVVGVFDGRGQLRGFGALEETERGGSGSAWVRWLVVAPSARRLGLGRSLLRALCEQGRARGLPEIRGGLPTGETAALRLFLGLGFHEEPASASGRCVLVRTLGG